MKVYKRLLEIIEEKGAAYLVLVDPDKTRISDLDQLISNSENADVDGFLIGGSLLLASNFQEYVKTFKSKTKLPVIIFPGGVEQVSPDADAILFLSIISGRNADNLIGKHVLAAPILKSINLEAISTGYMLIESGKVTTAEFMSGSKPIPREKNDIAVAHALAAEYLGFKLIYLEAGSGAQESVPEAMIKAVSTYCSVPLIVGGGIRDFATAKRKVMAGAKIIVTGNFFNEKNNYKELKNFADAIHVKINKNAEV